MDYIADKGSCIINGVGFNNGYGDGKFRVFYSDTLPDGFKMFEDVWFDLREDCLEIWEYDCDKSKTMVFSSGDLGCDAVRFAYKNGDICIVKYF